MAFRLYNTLTKQKENFEPVTPGKVGIYLCGPTVYKESHIGHVIGPVIFDALKKYLTYKGYQVKFVVNITDVDDKIINEAKRLGVPMKDLAEKLTAAYFDALDQLGVNSIDEFPRATEYIPKMIELIQRLAEKDAAYATETGDVYFDVTKCSNYGKLSHRKSDDQLEGSRELAGGGKRNAADFALWKAAGADEVGWDSPWSRGRPGWHIECSVMSMALLGETYDIHGGGMDLIFPHHENEIAQSETATCKPYVKYWLHNGLTRIQTKVAGGEWKNEKMSKSLGNIRPISELLEAYPPAVIRYFLLSTHYRRPIDFSDQALTDAQKGMMNIYRLLDRVNRLNGEDVYRYPCDVNSLTELAHTDEDHALREVLTAGQLKFLETLDDDFNTAGALAALHDLATAVNRYIDRRQLETKPDSDARTLALQAGRMITTLGRILGVFTEPLKSADSDDELTEKLMALLIDLRAQVRKDKNFALADAIRDKLTALGIALEDRPEGTIWVKM
ncbi:MAG: cysteine--tRNA ligase [Sedimentisphaerales bacterium]|nr:cysteine--tRNA ligase [Sedimentisphaerales bacterium]